MSESPFVSKSIEHAPPKQPPFPNSAAGRGADESEPSVAKLQFPVDSFADDCALMSCHIYLAKLVPVSLAASAILAVVSASLGSGLEVESGGDRRTRGNLFIVPIAQTGTGKDSALDLAMKPFLEIEQAAQSLWDQNVKPKLQARSRIAQKQIKKLEMGEMGDGKDIAKKMEEAIRERDGAVNALNSRPLLVTTDTTREALVASIATQAGESMAVITAEGRGAFSNILGRYTKGNASDEDVYCSCYSGTPINQQRRTKESISLRRPCLTMLLMVQPDVWRSLSAMCHLMESGLLQRFLAFDAKADPQPLPLKPHRISAEVSAKYAQLIGSLCKAYRQHEGEPHRIQCPLEAYEVLWAFENECRARRRTGGDFEDIAGFAARWAEQAWRLSVVLHAMAHGGDAHNHPLSVKTAESAIKLTRWFIQEQLDLLIEDRHKKHEERFKKLVELLNRKEGTLSLRDLKNSHGFTREEVLALQRDHSDVLRVSMEQGETGRPSEILSLIANQ